MKIDTPQRPPTPPSSPIATGAGGAHYFEPITILDATSATIGWTTLDLTQYNIPAGAKEVIFDAWYRIQSPDAPPFPFVYIRKNDSQQVPFILSYGEASSGGDKIGGANQGRFPITSDRKVDYQITTPGFDNGYTLRIIGYVL